ncbi:hypothetical protein F9L16_23790 [Agarivorans sp. B2Z047]|uniref:hypothetical protein n=1 Tax=Agarivorans sp. B2Z047 TaxID=2652721 RepID=UPI00128E7265|nr:hypothetical protein [Agarivorans sp. B2Z047]MPW31975.1 hypothetical protein [Agarivorans sp. B2Z047]UQN41959.1 hypothetical protein LQZ07_19610 [Agarivorans sp. B2Z047]
MSSIQTFFLFLFAFSGLGFVVWLVVVARLMSTSLVEIEERLDDQKVFSLNIFLAVQGVLQYGTVFMSNRHAKRFGLFEKRELIDAKTQKTYKLMLVSFLLLMCGLFSSALIEY